MRARKRVECMTRGRAEWRWRCSWPLVSELGWRRSPACVEAQLDTLAQKVDRVESLRRIKDLDRTFAQLAQFGEFKKMAIPASLRPMAPCSLGYPGRHGQQRDPELADHRRRRDERHRGRVSELHDH